jgi:hypothetical protein
LRALGPDDEERRLIAAYVIADITVHDPDTYEEYRRQVPP